MLIYFLLSRGRISIKSSIALGVRILDIRGIIIDEYSNINYKCLLDGRGASIKIHKNVDIAPFTKIWTLEHNPHCDEYTTIASNVEILDNCWVASSCNILPGSILNEFSVIASGTTIKGDVKAKTIIANQKTRIIGSRNINKKYTLKSIRRFR